MNTINKVEYKVVRSKAKMFAEVKRLLLEGDKLQDKIEVRTELSKKGSSTLQMISDWVNDFEMEMVKISSRNLDFYVNLYKHALEGYNQTVEAYNEEQAGKELTIKIEEIIEVERKKGTESFIKFKNRLAERSRETGIGYNAETGRIKSYTTLLKPQMESFLFLIEELVDELDAEVKLEVDNETYKDKCQRAVEIMVEDFEAGVDAEHLERLYDKGCKLYGKAFCDAIPKVIELYINRKVISEEGYMIQEYYSDAFVDARIREYKGYCGDSAEWNRTLEGMIEGFESNRGKWVCRSAKLNKAEALKIYKQIVKDCPQSTIRLISCKVCYNKESELIVSGFEPRMVKVIKSINY